MWNRKAFVILAALLTGVNVTAYAMRHGAAPPVKFLLIAPKPAVRAQGRIEMFELVAVRKNGRQVGLNTGKARDAAATYQQLIDGRQWAPLRDLAFQALRRTQQKRKDLRTEDLREIQVLTFPAKQAPDGVVDLTRRLVITVNPADGTYREAAEAAQVPPPGNRKS